MKKTERQIYIILLAEVGGTLCAFCRYSKSMGSGSLCDEDSYLECNHPLEVIHGDRADYMDGPGEDCWGFSPELNVRDAADIVGCILANFDPKGPWQWAKTAEGGIIVEGLRVKEKDVVRAGS